MAWKDGASSPMTLRSRMRKVIVNEWMSLDGVV